MGVERILGCLHCVLLRGAVAGVTGRLPRPMPHNPPQPLRGSRPCESCGELMHNPHWSRTRCPPCQEAHGREYRRAYSRARQRAKLATPEGRAEHAATMRRLLASNPDYAARHREACRLWRQRA